MDGDEGGGGDSSDDAEPAPSFPASKQISSPPRAGAIYPGAPAQQITAGGSIVGPQPPQDGRMYNMQYLVV